jgi:hypothetical protein
MNGFMLGAGLVLYRRFPLRLRLGFLSGEDRILRSEVIRRDVKRYAIEVEFGYHLPFFVGMTVSPLIGAAIDIDLIDEIVAGALDEGGCASPTCIYPVGIDVREETRFRARPQIGLSVTALVFRISYAFQLDLNQAGDSIHRLYLGVAF